MSWPGGAPSILRRHPGGAGAHIRPATTGLLATPPVAPPRGAPTPPRIAVPPFASPTLTPAPPIPLAGPGGPPLPAAAAPGPAATAAATGATVRRSLVDQLPASLFERARQALPGAATPAGSARTDSRPGPATSVIRRYSEGGLPVHPQSSQTEPHNPGGAPAVAASLTPLEWAELVDLIVERIEDRVTDELARRGRRYPPGVF